MRTSTPHPRQKTQARCCINTAHGSAGSAHSRKGIVGFRKTTSTETRVVHEHRRIRQEKSAVGSKLDQLYILDQDGHPFDRVRATHRCGLSILQSEQSNRPRESRRPGPLENNEITPKHGTHVFVLAQTFDSASVKECRNIIASLGSIHVPKTAS